MAATHFKPDKIKTPLVKESQQSFITQDQTENETPCPWVIESQQSLNTQDMNKIHSNSVPMKPANEEMSRKKMIPSELRQHLGRNMRKRQEKQIFPTK